MKKYALGLAYLGSIVLAAWFVNNVGTQHEPHGPHVLPVGFGLEAPSGVYVIGLTLVLRDLLQRRAGKAITFALMLVGTALAAFVSPMIALASAVAFLASETVDFAIFSAVERFGFLRAVMASNAVSIVVDSWLFLIVAFGSTEFIAGQVVGKAWATLAGVAVLWVLQRRRTDRRELVAA